MVVYVTLPWDHLSKGSRNIARVRGVENCNKIVFSGHNKAVVHMSSAIVTAYTILSQKKILNGRRK